MTKRLSADSLVMLQAANEKYNREGTRAIINDLFGHIAAQDEEIAALRLDLKEWKRTALFIGGRTDTGAS